MFVHLEHLLESLISTGTLTRAIDLQALDKLPTASNSYVVELPSTVVRELWEGERGRRSDIRLHIGVLGLSARLDTPRYKTQFDAIKQLASNGIDYDRLRDCMRYASTLGMKRKLFSKPQYGRFYKRPR